MQRRLIQFEKARVLGRDTGRSSGDGIIHAIISRDLHGSAISTSPCTFFQDLTFTHLNRAKVVLKDCFRLNVKHKNQVYAGRRIHHIAL